LLAVVEFSGMLLTGINNAKTTIWVLIKQL